MAKRNNEIEGLQRFYELTHEVSARLVGARSAEIDAALDDCLARLVPAVVERGGHIAITADHGNCELMVDPETGEPHTAHTTNPVPVWWVTADPAGRRLRDGGLADVAPTVLELLGLPRPAEMTGRSLVVREDDSD